MKSIVVHGGCGDEEIKEEKMKLMEQGVEKACELGFKKLKKGENAVEVVEKTLEYMENNPVFDAGTGSFYNLLNEIEMDAFIMNSRGEAGGVAGIKNVKNPICVSRKVMEELPHILLAGEGAELFARTLNFPEYDPGRSEQKDFLEKNLKDLPDSLEKFRQKYKKIREKQNQFSTVGAVALDEKGEIAAATSTGGIPQKLPGRVGDTPILGAGTYAQAQGGASATGMGEGIMKLAVTRQIIEKLKQGFGIQKACDSIIEKADEAQFTCGVVALDKNGKAGIAHNGRHMTYSSLSSG